MEPVTHFLTGACIGRAGFNRKTAYATLAAVLAAEAADLDVVWGFRGPVEELKHHRGITHTFVAVPVVAGLVVGAVWLLDRWLRQRQVRRMESRQRKEWQEPERRSPEAALHPRRSSVPLPMHPMRRRTDQLAPVESELATPIADATAPTGSAPPLPAPEPPAAPGRQQVHWGWLYLTTVVAALSHLLLDWTNNYGVRPFFPFNPRWYAGSFVPIVEPMLLMLLLAALLMPWLLGLADREMGVRKKPFRGRGWAVFALTGMIVVWCWRWAEHAQGLVMLGNSQVVSEPVTRMAVEPYLVNPYRWHAIIETRDYYQTAELNTRTGEINSDPEKDLMFKPADTPAVEAAKQTQLGKVYLDWGTWAVVRDLGPEPVNGIAAPDLPPNRQWTTVEFSDLRFKFQFLPSEDETLKSTLSGWVYIVDGRDEAGEAMAGREQK